LHERGHAVTSTKEAILRELLAADVPEPLAQLVLDYRDAGTRVGRYGLKFATQHVHPVTGRIHSNWLQLESVAGRMASAQPCLHNIPAGAASRASFRAPEGRVLILADSSQIELRIAAQLPGARRMLEAFQRGEDLPRAPAAAILGRDIAEVTAEDRQLAKALN